MLSISADRGIWLALDATDMRKSFDGLCGIVCRDFDREPHCGDVFAFFNRRRTYVKLLTWDGNGFCLYAKRLERGTFEDVRASHDGKVLAIDRAKLLMLLEGIDTKKSSFRRHYARSVRMKSGDGRTRQVSR